jgi:hypothetical protein
MTLSWNNTNVFDAVRYEVQLDTVNPPVQTVNLAGVQSSYGISLPYGTYYWRVRAVDAADRALDWSAVPMQSFTLSSTDSAAPLLNYYTTNMPTLNWSRVTWATGYEVQISKRSNFSGEIVYSNNTLTGANLSVTPDAALLDGIYFWRVRPKRPDGTWSSTWSSTDSFAVKGS